jgi:dTDP-glucose 4,6-dehydratase
MRILRDGIPGEAYHISTDRIISVRNVVHMICERMKARFDDCVEVVGERLGKDAAYRLDSSKVRERLGWRDKISLEQGLDDTIAWVESFFEDLKAQPLDYIHKH